MGLLAVPLLLASAQDRSAPGPVGGAPAVVERRLAAMGTWLGLSVRAPERAVALAASEAAVRAIEGAERRLSTWREDSELARLNRAPVGVEVWLSSELAEDLARARHYWEITSGAFDPGLGALIAAWGLRTGGHQPTPEERAAALAAGGFAAFELEGRRAVRHHPLALVEEGGFGKGLGLDAARAALAETGAESAVIDLGGQVVVWNETSVISLADPDERERPVLELRLAAGSLSTSGNSERGLVIDGVRRGHLLDPRTGEPAPDFGSLSVWAADATAADCLSTALYVLGPERAFAWRAEHARSGPAIELVVLERRDGRLVARASEGLRAELLPLDPALELVFASDPRTSEVSPTHK